MRYLSIILVLASCALCFYAGVQVGQSTQTAQATPTTVTVIEEEPSIEATAPPVETTEMVETTIEENQPEEKVEVLSYEVRAEAKIQTFTDAQGRALIAEIIEVNEDSLLVRRQVDSQKVTLPVSMLCAEDKGYAAYLFQNKAPAPTMTLELESPITSGESMSDKVWEELFK